MVNKPEFDVFLAHNSQDKPLVRAIANKLERRGIKVWIEEEQIPPGRSFQDVIQQAIQNVKSVAIFIGPGELGKWQMLELRLLMSQLVEASIPVIPVLLPGTEAIPKHLLFLQELNYVSFASGIDNAEALDRLAWGITRQKPKSPPQTSAEFDVVLCYNEEDQLEVKQIAEQLRERQIQPWLDLWEALDGTSWQQLLARQIDPIKSVAVFIGNKGGPWQRDEIESFIWESIELGRPVILVILSSTLQEPKLPIYLRDKTKVDFRHKDSDAINQLIRSITVEKQ
jgi:hypothetical protein